MSASMIRCSIFQLGRQCVQKRFPLQQQINWAFLPSIAHVHSSTTSLEAASEYLKKHDISVSDNDAPAPVLSFDQSNLPGHLLSKLSSDFDSPTPIQAQGLPIALSGKNMVGVAQTGSGKTLAFLLPALVHLAKEHERTGSRGRYEGPGVLILAPTRELAKQIEEVAFQFRKIAKFRTVCCIGGANRSRQLQQYDQGAQLMIGTPGRINDFLECGDINLSNCGFVVLDEADRMLDMGFEPQVRTILEGVRDERQTLMFSATWPEEVQELANEFLGDYTFMNIGSVELSANHNITQQVTICPQDYKQENFLNDMEDEMKGKKTLVFAERKTTVDRIERMLRNRQIPAIGIHGDKSQMQRETTIRRFKDGSCNVMIATDVAARGLDIKDVEYVVNYDFPLDIENYIHRIGRTGRADKKGKSITYMTPDDARYGDKLIKILREANQEVSPELEQLAEEGKYAKKLVRSQKKRDGWKQSSRNYSYRGLGHDDDDGYQPRRSQNQWGGRFERNNRDGSYGSPRRNNYWGDRRNNDFDRRNNDWE